MEIYTLVVKKQYLKIRRSESKKGKRKYLTLREINFFEFVKITYQSVKDTVKEWTKHINKNFKRVICSMSK